MKLALIVGLMMLVPLVLVAVIAGVGGSRAQSREEERRQRQLLRWQEEIRRYRGDDAA